MANNIQVLVNTGNPDTNKTFEVLQGSGKRNKPTIIKAVKGARYQLEEQTAKSTAPEKIRSKRVGKNLHVMLDGSKEADLIIENYYDEDMLSDNNRGLYGRAEDGKMYEYIPEDPTPEGLPINLTDGGRPVSQVLGGLQIGEAFELSGLIVAAAGFGPLGAAAAVAGGAALAAGGGGGGAGGAIIPAAPAAAPASFADNVGSKQSANSTDAKTDDTTPGINIGQVPAGTTPKLYVDGVEVAATYDSATGTLTPNTPLREGSHSITYTLSNSAGESAKSPAIQLTVDTTAPTTTASIDSISTDSGFSATDFVTNDATLLIKGVTSISTTGAAAGDQLLVEIKNNAGTVVATQYVKPDPLGNWELNNQANTLADGKYTIAVHVVDLAGNKVKADADTQVLIIDTNKGGTDASSNTNSSTGASEVDPNAASGVSVAITGISTDSGFSATDYITADGTLTISGTTTGFTNAAGTPSAGDKVRAQIVDASGKVVAQNHLRFLRPCYYYFYKH